MTKDEKFDSMGYDTFPYIDLSTLDRENDEIVASMELSCVAFIDILGFSEMVYKDIEKVVLALRYVKSFRDTYCRLPSTEDIDSDSHTLPKATMFSDSIVLSHPIDPYFDFYSFTYYIALLQMELLKKGILIRGGVEIGKLYHDDSFVFGDGLVKAYGLESKKAIYPRIMVGDKLLAKIEEQFEKDFEFRLKYIGAPTDWHEYENEDLEFLATDNDKCKFIDYLRVGLSSIDARRTKDDWNLQITLGEEAYNGEIQYISNFIQKGLLYEDMHIKEKYLWLKDRYNAVLEIFVNRSHGGQSNEYKKIWADRFIK